MKNKKLFVSVVALLCLTAMLLCACGSQEPAASGEAKTFTVQVVHADGTTLEKTITSTQTYLAHALIDEKILTDDGLETGMYLTVDGETADWNKDQAYWGFYVDGQYATKGMNDTAIEEGVTYKLEYTVG